MVPISYLVHYYTLLHNATDIIKKMQQHFYYEMRQKLITKCVKLFITKCDCFITDSYYKMRWFYYKMRQSLQIVTFITKYISTRDRSTAAATSKMEHWNAGSR